MIGSPAHRLRALLERPVLANSVAVVALRATNLVARLVLLFVIARHVPPATFGLLVFAVSIVEIAKVLSDFGMDTLAIREYAREGSAETNARFASALAAAKACFGGAVFLGLVGYFALTQPREQAQVGVIVGATVITALLANFSIDYFQARLTIRRILLPVMLTNLGLMLVAAALLPRIGDLRAQVAFFPAIEAVTGLVLLAGLRREGLPGRPVFALGRVPELARRSLPIAATGILIMTYSRLDVLMLSNRIDSAAVGIYGLAFRITEPFQMAAAAFGLSVFSRFSAWFRDPGAVPLRHAAVRYVLWTLGYGAVVAFALGVLAPPLVAWLFPSYASGIPVLRILAAALVFRTLNATLAGILLGAGRFRLLTGIALWNLAFTFVLLRVLIDRFAVPGAALALLVAEAVNTLIQWAAVERAVSAHGRAHVRVE